MDAIIKKKMWCYTAPNGVLQTRSLQDTKKICQEQIVGQFSDLTFKDYEKAGYKLHRVMVTITEIKN